MTWTAGIFLPSSFVISPRCAISGKWRFVIEIASGTISLAQIGVMPCLLAASGNTPIQEQFAQLLAEEKVTQEDIDTLYALVDHAQKPDYPTEPIEQIIQEEMAAYLDGVIDEKTTAERIQSRAGLYLMEQKVQ